MVELKDKPLVSPTNVIAVAQQKLPAVVTETRAIVFQRQDQFEDLMELRGKAPAPRRLVYGIFNGGASWGLVFGGAAAAIGFPLEAVGLMTTLGAAVTAGTVLMTGLVLGAIAGKDVASPLSLVTRRKHLTSQDLQFLGNIKEAPAVEQAVVGILAERWVARIDEQRVYGEKAYAMLEDVIAKKNALPYEILVRAKRIVAVHDATRHPEYGYRLWSLTAAQAYTIADAVEALDPADRASCAAELRQRYFKGEVERHHIEDHKATRRLYRVLHDGTNESSAAS